MARGKANELDAPVVVSRAAGWSGWRRPRSCPASCRRAGRRTDRGESTLPAGPLSSATLELLRAIGVKADVKRKSDWSSVPEGAVAERRGLARRPEAADIIPSLNVRVNDT